MKNDVKNDYRETPRMEIIEKWSKNAIFPSGTLPKKMKMIVFRVHFCKSEVRVPFYIHFSFILTFNFEPKWNGKWLKNGLKMPTVNDPDDGAYREEKKYSMVQYGYP